MKTMFFFFFLVTLICSCEQEGDLTQDAVSIVVDQPNTVNKYQGVFSPTSGINGSGIVKIFLE